ncbi:hypothetical protein SAMN05660477_02977 [Soonwooa buanensis]|uniref:Uncharacterized protein n=1 Tax=Soonwooa buanensis TaxID=619805 RepID=A0A1T5GM51_9FLAO|nr:hypothetical protein [Soonwooa buanensis]SKC09482.1 hypothetical protein SAMN05660477_02977 [Soonwooa buanensis]
MKKVILFFVLIVFGQTFAQSNIEGIGIFKINKTKVAIIDSLKNVDYMLQVCEVPQTCNISSYASTTSKKIFELKKQDKIVSDYPLIDNAQVFILSKYDVADFTIKELRLKFYNGVLYDIHTDNIIPLVQKLELKYKSEPKVDEKEITCSSVYGQYKRTEGTYTTVFRDDTINASSVMYKFHNSKCKADVLAFFTMYDKKTSEAVRLKSDAVKAEIKQKQDVKTAEALKGL